MPEPHPDHTFGAPGMLSPGVTVPHRARRPQHAGSALSDAMTLAGALIVVTIGIWARHGGWTALTGGVWAESWESLGALTGLLATSVALIGIAFASRTHRFERAVGLDRALLWHRWMGETAALLLVAHIVTTTIAYASLSSFGDAIVELTRVKSSTWRWQRSGLSACS